MSSSAFPGPWDTPENVWRCLRCVLREHGDILTVRYPAFLLSCADADKIAQGVNDEVQAAYAKHGYQKIVLIGYSAGAPIARKAFLYGSDATMDEAGKRRQPRRQKAGAWGEKVERIVLLASMGRGWDISGIKPLDMTRMRYFEIWLGSWLAGVTGSGQLVHEMETGAPFIADLRLEWMRWFRRPGVHRPPIVQLLGDIDDLVSDADNKDLRAAVSGTGPTTDFTWVKVRGTGHRSILDFDDPSEEGGRLTLGAYRQAKVTRAVLRPIKEVHAENEELPLPTDNDVKRIVVVLHGIRDLGRWSSAFETELRRHPEPDRKLAIASFRYGYFGMGPFILMPDRQKYVRWLMDQYTETVARFPNAEAIDFFGHSNGTYLLASALERYRSLEVDRVVFAGSVVRRDYKWDKRFSRKQVGAVRNYVASDDFDVALFPRFFEQGPVFFLLHNDLGSASFNGFGGFDPGRARYTPGHVENVGYVTGGHGAFLSRIEDIVAYLDDNPPHVDDEGAVVWLQVISEWFCWLVWLIMVFVVVRIGIQVAKAARTRALIALVVYVLMILWVLHDI
jgi:pimeloyl-ACP methyl ester carboxylesterase